ncbi:MAG: hypothetical protein ACOYMN_01520 [Roseimicrobium sp.]
MVFSSFQFVLAFLPVTVVGFMLLQRYGFVRTSSYWLIAASLFFYAWWDYRYLLIPLGSVVFNYWLGKRLLRPNQTGEGLLIFGIAMNLGLLGYYKYAGFFAENLVSIFGLPIEVPHIALPLAICPMACTFRNGPECVRNLIALSGGDSHISYELHIELQNFYGSRAMPPCVRGPIGSAYWSVGVNSVLAQHAGVPAPFAEPGV